jgi:hypothetical protein
MGQGGPKYCVQRMMGLKGNGGGRGIDSRLPGPHSFALFANEWGFDKIASV